MTLPRITAWVACIGTLFCFLASVSMVSAETVPLRAMSFNVRYAGTTEDVIGTNGWYNLTTPSAGRVYKAIQVIRDNAPDIIGTQEALDVQIKDLTGQTLAAGLTDYGYYGVGRTNGVAAGEYAAIFYKADRFTQLNAGTFWLSPTPDVAGSIYPGAGSIRIASWVLLDDHLSHQQLFVLNTHMDNVGDTANNYAANLIRQRLPGLAGNAPILLTGDMNSTASSTVVRTLMGLNDPTGLQLGDAYREVHPVVQSNEATYHAYTGNTGGSRIDFTLHTSELTPVAAEIVRTSYNGKYPSDHFPVTAQFTMAVVPEPATSVLLATGAVVVWSYGRRTRRSARMCAKSQ
jgi:endonuclease/exonuclease/phosphatase family metal-dependent hydrolase